MSSNTSEFIAQSRLISDGELTLHYIIGTLMLIFTIVGVSGNSMVVVLFTKHSCLNGRTSLLLRSLAISDGTLALIGGTMFTVNCFGHRWMFSEGGCIFHAFVMYWCGVTSMAHLCAISVERAITITNPVWSMANRGKISGYAILMVIFCWLYGLLWAVLPFFGFQRYTVEGYVSCSIDWFDRRPTYMAYHLVIFFTAFFIPFLIMCCSHFIILYCVHNSLFRGYGDNKSKLPSSVKDNQSREWKIARSLLAATGVYIVAWSPYAIMAMWVSFGDVREVPYAMFDALGFFAKMSFVLNPLVYVGTNKMFRTKLMKLKVAVSEASNSTHAVFMSSSKPVPRDDAYPVLSPSAASSPSEENSTLQRIVTASGRTNQMTLDESGGQDTLASKIVARSPDASTSSRTGLLPGMEPSAEDAINFWDSNTDAVPRETGRHSNDGGEMLPKEDADDDQQPANNAVFTESNTEEIDPCQDDSIEIVV